MCPFVVVCCLRRFFPFSLLAHLMFCGITTPILFVDLNLTDVDCNGHDSIPCDVSHSVFSATCGFFVWWSFNFPNFRGPTFSPFPFPLSPFPKYTNKLSAQTTKIRIKLKLSHTLLSTTGVQLFSKQGGLCFLWRLFSLGGGRGAGKHPIGGGGGWVGGVSCEEFGMDNGGGVI